MDLFGLCQHCDLPIFVTEDVTFCPYCAKELPDDDTDFASDTLSNFIREMKMASSFEWNDIQRLIYAVDTIIAINTRISQELGISLVELHNAHERIDFYRNATTFRIK
tara:strand:- start:9026 stop:9349 length:324 start_codon:yes stop_codon:yes gene_type:complete